MPNTLLSQKELQAELAKGVEACAEEAGMTREEFLIEFARDMNAILSDEEQEEKHE